jgi:anti-sigma factor RsiW
MTCDIARRFLDAYVDRELDAANTLNMEEHLASCDACAQLRANREALRSVIATEGPRYRAPEALRARIQADLRQSAGRAAPPAKMRAFDWKWGAIAALVLVTALALWQARSRNGEQMLIADLVSDHVRSLMANHLVDEPSSDQHAVKPWFAGKLDFSPTVKNLDSQGFPLAGGRLDYLNGRAVAAIVYRRRQHIINVFVWPSTQDAAGGFRTASTNGFNAVHWTSGGLSYWAVSDLNSQELEQFARLCAQPG